MEIEEEKRLKMAVISGAAKALRFKEENPKSSEQEVMQHITDSTEKILENMDEEL